MTVEGAAGLLREGDEDGVFSVCLFMEGEEGRGKVAGNSGQRQGKVLDGNFERER